MKREFVTLTDPKRRGPYGEAPGSLGRGREGIWSWSFNVVSMGKNGWGR